MLVRDRIGDAFGGGVRFKSQFKTVDIEAHIERLFIIRLYDRDIRT